MCRHIRDRRTKPKLQRVFEKSARAYDLFYKAVDFENNSKAEQYLKK